MDELVSEYIRFNAYLNYFNEALVAIIKNAVSVGHGHFLSLIPGASWNSLNNSDAIFGDSLSYCSRIV